MDFAGYYGITVRLCYPYRPQTKGKIENTIKFLRYNFFAGRTFSDLNDINIQCREWMDRLKKEILNKTSSVKPYVARNEESRKVSRECYVSFKGNRYSVL